MRNITETIKRLQALAGSSNVHESALAARIAADLIAKRDAAKAGRRKRATVRHDSGSGTAARIKAAARVLKRGPLGERIADVIDGKVNCVSLEATEEIAAELRTMGLADARAFGCAVVFWS